MLQRLLLNGFTGELSRKLVVMLAEWADALSWCSKILLRQGLGHLSLIFSKAVGRQTLVHHCAVTVLWFSRATVVTCPVVEKVATILFPTPLGIQW